MEPGATVIVVAECMNIVELEREMHNVRLSIIISRLNLARQASGLKMGRGYLKSCLQTVASWLLQCD